METLIKLRSLQSAFTVAVMLCCFAADVRAGTEIPRSADISVLGMFLSDPESTRRVLEDPPEPLETGDDFPTVQICNSNNTELLILVFHYGDVKDSFNEVRIRNISKPPTNCLEPPKQTNHFVTGKGIRLGISKKELTIVFGPGFTENAEGSRIVIRYRIDNFDKSNFLKKYNLPIYYGTYHFEKDKLIKFEFGFEYP